MYSELLKMSQYNCRKYFIIQKQILDSIALIDEPKLPQMEIIIYRQQPKEIMEYFCQIGANNADKNGHQNITPDGDQYIKLSSFVSYYHKLVKCLPLRISAKRKVMSGVVNTPNGLISSAEIYYERID